MLKIQAIKLFGETNSDAARAIGVTYQAIAKWPDVLPSRISDRVLGACVRLGKEIPQQYIAAAPSPQNNAEGPL